MGEDPGNPLWMFLLITLILTGVQGFFSAAEMALASVDKNKFQERAEEGEGTAKRVLLLLAEPSRLMATMQWGITLCGFFNAALAAHGLGQPLGAFLAHYGMPRTVAYDVAFIATIFMLCLFILVFGEHLPKRLVAQDADRFIYRYSALLLLFVRLSKPFVRFTQRFTTGILKLLGVDLKRLEVKVTREKIRSWVEVAQEQNVLGEAERAMIESVIDFDDRQADEIMTARTEVFMIDIDDPPEAYTREMLSLKYSRIPVYKDNPDNILGLLYIKDYLLQAYKKGFDGVRIASLLRPAYFVPERKNVSDVFAEMQNTRRHMALLIDEYGGFSGLVTMEDLIEEIMGDIDDEYDHDEPDIYEESPGIYRVHGTISIKEFNSETGAEIDEDSEDYDTIGGFLISRLDYIPEDGERPVVEEQGMRFHVLKVEDKRLRDIRVQMIEDESQEV